jgi:hypothetical protein
MFNQLAGRLDLAVALRDAASNDLLPPREDDRVTGEVGRRFVEHLDKQIADGQYEADRASFVQVPTPGFTSRPAALLTLTDRVVYEAIVAQMRPPLGRYLLPDDVVLWPRQNYVRKRWSEFEGTPLAREDAYVVEADVSGFYESIDHYQLEDDIVLATGDRPLAAALREFLSRVMGTRRGIPQGLLPSDTLATIYLQPVDAGVLQQAFDYWRHGDDFRIAAPTISRAREAILTLEEQLRQRGLLLNSSKVKILTREQYAQHLRAGTDAFQRVRAAVYADNVARLRSDSDELSAAMEQAGLDEQRAWNFFYHGTISLDEVIEQLRPHLAPSDVQIAERMLAYATENAPDKSSNLSKEQFHFLISRSLIQLAAARSPAALEHASSLIARFPEKTEIVCSYLLALNGTFPREAVAAAENIVGSAVFTTTWQQAWLYRVLAANADHISPPILERLQEIASEMAHHWLAKVEAMKVLAQAGRLDRNLLARCWNLAPRPYRCALLTAAAMVKDVWGMRFLQASRLDPVERVVANHLAEVFAG